MKTSEVIRKLREDTEYQAAFKKAMQESNISSPADLKDPAKKKQFFTYLDENFKAKVEAAERRSLSQRHPRGAYYVHPSSSPELKKAAGELNSYIKKTKAAEPLLLVGLVLALVEAEIDQYNKDRSSELDIEL